MSYVGVKFAEGEHLEALQKYGLCAFRVTSEEREANHPSIGDVVHLLLDESTRGRRVSVRLVAEQIAEDGSSICMFAPSVFAFRRDVR